LGISYANLELFEEAIEPFDKVISLNNLEPVYLHERAKCYILTDKFD
jgi:hypothetical protein